MRTLHTSARPVSRQGTIVFDPRVPATPRFPSDVYGIMTQRSDSARPRPYAELDQALHTLGGYVLLVVIVVGHSICNKVEYTVFGNSDLSTTIHGW